MWDKMLQDVKCMMSCYILEMKTLHEHYKKNFEKL